MGPDDPTPAEKLRSAIEILKHAQVRNTGWADIDDSDITGELLDVLSRGGLADEGWGPFGEFPEKSGFEAAFNILVALREEREALTNPNHTVLVSLQMMAKRKGNPLKSRRCDGRVQDYIERGLRRYDPEWLKLKGFDPRSSVRECPVVVALNRKQGRRRRRLDRSDWEKIRCVIIKLILNDVRPKCVRVPRDHSEKKWWERIKEEKVWPMTSPMEMAVMALAEIFFFYAPPVNCDERGIASLPASDGSSFIRFAADVLQPFAPDGKDVTTKAVGAIWRKQKAIMEPKE
jgi:hypothetical protein